MNYFYADASNRPVGPVSESELPRLLAAGVLQANSWVIAQGDTQWKPLSAVVPVSGPPPAPALYVNPYTTPAAVIPAYGTAVDPAHMPGLRRPGYFFSMLGLGIAGYFALAAVLGVTFSRIILERSPQEVTRAEVMEMAQKAALGAGAVGLVAMIGALLLMSSRLRNIGWSPWLCLIAFVPLANIWVGFSCMILPPGYVHTKKFDTAAVVLLILGLLGIAGAVAGGVMVAEEYERQRRLHPERFEDWPSGGWRSRNPPSGEH